jgi:ribosome-binding factor A
VKVNVGNPYAVSRLAKRIKLIITNVLENELWLNRNELITVTHVKISSDRHYVDVYFSVMGDTKTVGNVKKYFADRAGIFRNAVAQNISLRKAPRINFIFDPLIKQVSEFDEKFAELRRRDADLKALRAQTQSNQINQF